MGNTTKVRINLGELEELMEETDSTIVVAIEEAEIEEEE